MNIEDADMERAGSESIVAALWTYKALSVPIVVLVALVAAGFGLVQSPQPTAAASFGVIGQRDSLPGATSSASSDVQLRNVQDQAAFATSERVLVQAAGDLGSGTTLGQLRTSVTATADLTANVVQVVASAPSTALAERRADAVVAAYRKLNGDDVAGRVQAAEDALNETQRQLEAARGSATATAAAAQTLANVQNQLVSVRVYARTFGDGVRYVNSAKPVHAGVLAMPATRDGILGLAFGLLLASIVAVIRSSRATRSRRSGTRPARRHALSEATAP